LLRVQRVEEIHSSAREEHCSVLRIMHGPGTIAHKAALDERSDLPFTFDQQQTPTVARCRKWPHLPALLAEQVTFGAADAGGRTTN